MNGALALHLLETHTVAHIDKLASTLGGTVILKIGAQSDCLGEFGKFEMDLQLCLPCLKPKSRDNRRLALTFRNHSRFPLADAPGKS
jgi:hypothetical protein